MSEASIGRLAFITGASSGIGQSLAARFVQAGWRVALVARRADEMTQWAQAQGWSSRQWAVYGADVRDEQSLQAAAQDCLATLGVPEVVIANAGISMPPKAATTSGCFVTNHSKTRLRPSAAATTAHATRRTTPTCTDGTVLVTPFSWARTS